jgi:hypothetical protein
MPNFEIARPARPLQAETTVRHPATRAKGALDPYKEPNPKEYRYNKKRHYRVLAEQEVYGAEDSQSVRKPEAEGRDQEILSTLNFGCAALFILIFKVEHRLRQR